MAINMSPIETLKGWGDALNTPFGYIGLLAVAVYIYLRVTGKIGSVVPFLGQGGDKRGSSNKIGGNRPPDYIIK